MSVIDLVTMCTNFKDFIVFLDIFLYLKAFCFVPLLKRQRKISFSYSLCTYLSLFVYSEFGDQGQVGFRLPFI